MEQKVESIRENVRQFTGKFGQMYVHAVKVAGDPEEWEYNSKSATCDSDRFAFGFTTEVKEFDGPKGKFSKRIIAPVPPPKENKPAYGGGGKKDDKDQGVITALSAASSAAAFYSNRGTTVNDDQLVATAEKIFKWAKTKSTNSNAWTTK